MKLIRKAALACLVLLTACTSASDKSSVTEEDEASRAPETTVVRLALNSSGHIMNAIAEAQGYLEEEGITVEYVPTVTDQDAFEGIKNGTIDIASNSGTNLPLQYISEGMDLTIFGGYLLTGCMPLFTRAETEWNGIEDLIGKTVACEPNLYAITGPLLNMGHDPLIDITWYETGTQEERIQAVKDGRADFGLVGTALNYAVNSDPELKIVTYAADVLPAYSCCRAEALTSWVEKNPNTVRALLRAWIRAMEYYYTHHDETVKLVMKLTGNEEAFVRAYMDNPRCDLNIDPMRSSVKRAWRYMGGLGLFSIDARQIDIDDHINVTLYKEALDECQRKYGSEDPKFYEKLQSQYSKNNQ